MNEYYSSDGEFEVDVATPTDLRGPAKAVLASSAGSPRQRFDHGDATLVNDDDSDKENKQSPAKNLLAVLAAADGDEKIAPVRNAKKLGSGGRQFGDSWASSAEAHDESNWADAKEHLDVDLVKPVKSPVKREMKPGSLVERKTKPDSLVEAGFGRERGVPAADSLSSLRVSTHSKNGIQRTFGMADTVSDAAFREKPKLGPPLAQPGVVQEKATDLPPANKPDRTQDDTKTVETVDGPLVKPVIEDNTKAAAVPPSKSEIKQKATTATPPAEPKQDVHSKAKDLKRPSIPASQSSRRPLKRRAVSPPADDPVPTDIALAARLRSKEDEVRYLRTALRRAAASAERKLGTVFAQRQQALTDQLTAARQRCITLEAEAAQAISQRDRARDQLAAERNAMNDVVAAFEQWVTEVRAANGPATTAAQQRLLNMFSANPSN